MLEPSWDLTEGFLSHRDGDAFATLRSIMDELDTHLEKYIVPPKRYEDVRIVFVIKTVNVLVM